MRIFVVGLGSMGKRRIRLIKKYNPTLEIIGIDTNPLRTREVSQQYGINCIDTIEDSLLRGEMGCAFVCTSPLSHYAVSKNLLNRGLNIFSEINLVGNGYRELIDLANRNNRVLFLSSTFLYRRDIQYIISRSRGERINYVYHTGQFLPDWHPWENYKDFFVADKRTNGCREIMAIEFPWLIECFGNIHNIYAIKGNMSHLEINYCDNYLLNIQHENGNCGIVAIDIVSRLARRALEVYGENRQLFWEGTPSSLKEFDVGVRQINHIETYDVIEKDSRYCENIIENAYMDEIVAFLYQVESGKTDKTLYSFEKDINTLKWINKIEGGNGI